MLIFFRIPLSEASAIKVRDSLAKAIYKFIKDHIIEMFNKTEELSMPYIGIFDIAGFGLYKSSFLWPYIITSLNFTTLLQNFVKMEIIASSNCV